MTTTPLSRKIRDKLVELKIPAEQNQDPKLLTSMSWRALDDEPGLPVRSSSPAKLAPEAGTALFTPYASLADGTSAVDVEQIWVKVCTCPM